MTRSSCGLRHESSEGLRFDAHGSRKSVRRRYHGASPTATNERRFTAQTQVSGPHTLSRVTAPVHSCGASPADARKKTNRRAVKRRHRSQFKSHAEFATEFQHADSIVKLLHCRPWTDLTDDSVLSRATGTMGQAPRLPTNAVITAQTNAVFTAQTQVSGAHTLSRVTAPVHSCGASPADARKKTNRRAVKRRHRSQSKSHAEFATEFHHADSIVKLLHCRPWTDLTDDSVLSRETVPYSSAVSRLLHIGSTQEPGGRSWLYVEANQSSDR